MSKITLTRGKARSARCDQLRMAAVAVAIAGVTGVATTPAIATPTSSLIHTNGTGVIGAGLEDGTFRGTCLTKNPVAPSTKVLDSPPEWRNGMRASVVRVLVPWNIAVPSKKHKRSPQATCLINYLRAAARNKIMVEVSLNRTGGDADYPSLRNYTKAVKALAKMTDHGSLIKYLTAYNEPNNPSYLNNKYHQPAARSGAFYRIANRSFPGKVIAGDFAANVSKSFLQTYIKALHGQKPRLWALHPYTDITNFQFFMHQKKPHRSARQAARATLNWKNSYVVPFAHRLKDMGQGSALIWLDEIYVTHRADRNPPKGVDGKKGEYHKNWKKGHRWTGTTFSKWNQGYAELFLDGGLGTDSIPGYLAAHGLPRVTRFVYMRADTKSLPEADVLIINQRGCLWYTFSGVNSKPAPQCK